MSEQLTAFIYIGGIQMLLDIVYGSFCIGAITLGTVFCMYFKLP